MKLFIKQTVACVYNQQNNSWGKCLAPKTGADRDQKSLKRVNIHIIRGYCGNKQYGIEMWPGLPLCVQCADQTLARMTDRVDWSRPLARKCVTADVATAGRTVALVSKSRTAVTGSDTLYVCPPVHVSRLHVHTVHACSCTCVIMVWLTVAGEDMSELLNLYLVVVTVVNAYREVVLRLVPTDSSVKERDLLSRR